MIWTPQTLPVTDPRYTEDAVVIECPECKGHCYFEHYVDVDDVRRRDCPTCHARGEVMELCYCGAPALKTYQDDVGDYYCSRKHMEVE